VTVLVTRSPADGASGTPRLGGIRTGHRGERREQAVPQRARQSAVQALVPDGVAGPRAWAALPSGHPMRRLRDGDTGAIVLLVSSKAVPADEYRAAAGRYRSPVGLRQGERPGRLVVIAATPTTTQHSPIHPRNVTCSPRVSAPIATPTGTRRYA
jgi:hypothetical protein